MSGRSSERPLEDLRLYGRTDEVFAAHANLAVAYRARQDRLKEQQRLYRQRLKQLAIAARQTLRAVGDAEMINAEQRHAIAQLRALDRHHLQRTETIHARFQKEFDPSSLSFLAEHMAAIRDTIGRTTGVLITGGNVVILLNRMRLFGLAHMLREVPVIGWSAGAMVLAERVILFHDRTPQGRRDAEVLGAGCSLIANTVVLPDAKRRLRKRDRPRMTLLGRRFAPDSCVVLDSGAAIGFQSGRVLRQSGARRVDRAGHMVKVNPS